MYSSIKIESQCVLISLQARATDHRRPRNQRNPALDVIRLTVFDHFPKSEEKTQNKTKKNRGDTWMMSDSWTRYNNLNNIMSELLELVRFVSVEAAAPLAFNSLHPFIVKWVLC